MTVHEPWRRGRPAPASWAGAKRGEGVREGDGLSLNKVLLLLVPLDKDAMHLGAAPVVAALLVKELFFGAAVEDALGAADVAGDRVEGLEHAQAEALALVGLGDADFLNMANAGPVPDTATRSAGEGGRARAPKAANGA